MSKKLILKDFHLRKNLNQEISVDLSVEKVIKFNKKKSKII